MEKSVLGKTGLEVSRLGAGLSGIGEELTMDEVDRAGQVVNTALDGGINFLDTSANYYISEELIGQTVSHRRAEYVLATKAGNNRKLSDVGEWTAQFIEEQIDRSLTRMKTDYLDLVQLHSCDVNVLEAGEAVEALLEAQRKGKTRFVGYSGDNDAAAWAVQSGLFDTLETSFCIADQHARTRLFGPAKAQEMGIIVKRPIANGAWRARSSPTAGLRLARKRTYGDEYFRRCQIMAEPGPIEGEPEDRIVASLGFALAHPEVDTAIVGTQDPSHMRRNIETAQRGISIPASVVDELHRRFDELEDDWVQLI